MDVCASVDIAVIVKSQKMDDWEFGIGIWQAEYLCPQFKQLATIDGLFDWKCVI